MPSIKQFFRGIGSTIVGQFEADKHALKGDSKKYKEANQKLTSTKKQVSKQAKALIRAGKDALQGDFRRVDRNPDVQRVVAVVEEVATGNTKSIDNILEPQKTFLNTSGALELSKKVTKDAGMRILGFLEAIGRAILIPFVAIYEVFKAIATGDAPDMNSYFHTIKQSFTLEK